MEPEVLRPMLIKYFHDSTISGHLGAFKSWKKLGRQFLWPQLKNEVFQYVKQGICNTSFPNVFGNREGGTFEPYLMARVIFFSYLL